MGGDDDDDDDDDDGGLAPIHRRGGCRGERERPPTNTTEGPLPAEGDRIRTGYKVNVRDLNLSLDNKEGL